MLVDLRRQAEGWLVSDKTGFRLVDKVASTLESKKLIIDMMDMNFVSRGAAFATYMYKSIYPLTDER